MKRILAVALCLLVVVAAFAGCKNENADTDKNEQVNNETIGVKEEKDEDTLNKGYITSKESFIKEVERLIDVSLYQDFDETDSESFNYQIDYENEKEYDLDYKITLGDGSEFTMPISFAELEKKGWVLRENSQPDREIESGYMTYGTVENSVGKSIYVTGYNGSEKTTAFKNCSVIATEMQQYSSLNPSEKIDEAVDFTICGTITNKSTLEDIIKRLGNPTSIACYLDYNEEEYVSSEIIVSYTQESSAYSSIEFKLSGDGNYITNVKYSVNPENE